MHKVKFGKPRRKAASFARTASQLRYTPPTSAHAREDLDGRFREPTTLCLICLLLEGALRPAISMNKVALIFGQLSTVCQLLCCKVGDKLHHET